LLYDCNHFIPFQEGIKLKPYRLWNNIIKVPYSWEDDIACIYGDLGTSMVVKEDDELNVFDFHPIHVFLNTNNLSLYESTRAIHREVSQMIKSRWYGEGTRSWLEDVLSL